MNENGSSRLVDYSSDEETDDEKKSESGLENSLKIYPITSTKADESNQSLLDDSSRREALPLPSSIQQMFQDIPGDVDDENPLNCGRKIRSFPHERGVWATYVYIEYCPSAEFLDMIEKLRVTLSDHGISLELPDNFHVSLSRTLKLRHHWIVPFVDALKTNLSCFYRFKLIFQSLEVYENEEKTRTFLGLKVHIGYERLLKLAEEVDKCLSEFKLPCFYENPSFHLSFASCVGSQAEKIELLLADLNVIFQSCVEYHTDIRTLWVTKICCKSGNKLFTVNLKT